MQLTSSPTEVHRQFEEQGYYLAKEVFNSTEVAELEQDFDHIVRQITATSENVNARWSGPEMEKMGAAGTVVIHTHQVQMYSAAWARAFYNAKFLEVATAILGPDVVLHHSKLFQKPSENGAPFPMHQDWGYFPTIHDTMMAGIIHVSKATDEMGCLRVYPGSHKLGRIPEAQGGTERLLRDFPIENATPLIAEPGDVAFFHYCTIHGSLPNRSSEIRKTVLAQFHSGNDRCEDGVVHPNARLVLAGWNHYATRESVNAD